MGRDVETNRDPENAIPANVPVSHGPGLSVQPSAPGGAATAFDDWDEAPLPDSEIADLFLSLDKAIRARRLYQENNPVFQGFVANARRAFTRLWAALPSLTVAVEEGGFRCFGKDFPSKEGREGMPFLFYRDGVRVLTFLPGFEDEIDLFVAVIDRARQMGPKATDDIVTLLWEEEFSSFQYSYVDLLADVLSVPGASERPHGQIERQRLEHAIEGTEFEAVPPAVEAGAPPVSQAVALESFVETTYFLEPDEAERLQQQAEAEWRRDVRSAVLDALFDRLEDAAVKDLHAEILRVLGQLLPAFLGRGDLRNATTIVVEVGGLLGRSELSGEERTEAERLLRELNDPQVLNQFLGSLEDGTIDPAVSDLALFLSYLGADSLPLLLRATERSESARLREKLAAALGDLAMKHAAALVGLIAAPDEGVAHAAAYQAGLLKLKPAVPPLLVMYRKADVKGRRRAIETLAAVADATALETVQEALRDDDREVRIAAAHALAAMRNPAALPALRAAVRGRGLREADLTEQIAVFEAFGAVAAEGDIELLDSLLNGRRLLGRASPETRACAAMALGAVGTPTARASLVKSAKDPQPIVRNAVSKALARIGRPS